METQSYKRPPSFLRPTDRGVMFTYESLDPERRNIRLINMLPVKTDEIISCQIETVSLDDLPIYTALSYVWGDAADTRPILLDGHSHEVTVNLERALRNLGRKASEPQKIWIDALCVNQQDVSERSQQVSLMDAIYKQSNNVIVWLGEWDLEAIISVQQTNRFLEDLASDRHFQHIPLLSESDGSYDETRSEICSIIEYLTSKTYWNRAWIVQEFCLPKCAEIVCGPFSVDRDFLIRAILNFTRHLGLCCSSPTSSRGSLGSMYRILPAFEARLRPFYVFFTEQTEGTRQPMTLWELLLDFRSAEASDHRDKIFAFLGLAEAWPKGQPLLPDYSMTSYDLYMTVGLRMLDESQSLLLLTQCTQKISHPQLPSWIPDWTASEGSHPLYLEQCLILEDLFQAPGRMPVFPMVPCGSVLMLQAIKVDTIRDTKILDVTSLLEIVALVLEAGAAWLPTLGSTVEESLRTQISDRTGHQLMRTAIGDVLMTESEQQPSQKGLSLARWRRLRDDDLNVLTEFLAQVKAGLDIERIMQHPNPLYRQLVHSIHSQQLKGNQLLILDQNFVGLGPQAAQEGDEIWIMPSSPVPMILRPLRINAPEEKGLSGMHQLVARCYVDGIMDGQAAENYEKLEILRIA